MTLHGATVRTRSETRVAVDGECTPRLAGCCASMEMHCVSPGRQSSRLQVSSHKPLMQPPEDRHFSPLLS